MADVREIQVEVAYATPARQFIRSVVMPAGCRVAEAIRASGVLEEFPELGADGRLIEHADRLVAQEFLAGLCVGIFGERVPLDAHLHGGERVEIYRPLQVDPKELRRRRAGAKRNG